jgi:hypothetical protein
MKLSNSASTARREKVNSFAVATQVSAAVIFVFVLPSALTETKFFDATIFLPSIEDSVAATDHPSASFVGVCFPATLGV